MSDMTVTNADLTELENDRAAARKFFWWWLIAATTLTLMGNAGHALLPQEPPAAVSLAVALVPPVIALIALHGLMVLARVGEGHRAKGSARFTFASAVVVTVLLALEALVISYAGIYDVALRTGMHIHLARVFPLAIDLGIALCTLALYHLRPASAADVRAAKAATKAANRGPETIPSRPAPRPGARESRIEPTVEFTPDARESRTSEFSPESAQPREARITTPAHREPEPRESHNRQFTHESATVRDSRTDQFAMEFSDAHLELAERVRANGDGSGKSVEEIARVLTLHANGESQRTIAASTGFAAKTVRGITASAAKLERPHLVSMG